MGRYQVLLGVVVLGCGAALGACSSSDDGGGSDPTLSTLAATVSEDAGADGEGAFVPGLGCEGATLPSATTAGGQVTILTCLNHPVPGVPHN